MRKRLLIIVAVAILLLIASIIWAIVVSFTIIKPTTESINQKLVQKMASVVRIPQGILPPSYDIDQTSFFWEMETLEKEVTGVRFKYQTGFFKNQNKIEAVLEMPENGDPALFNKVLPAVIADGQSLRAAQDIEKADLSANQMVGYQQIRLAVKRETKQATKIIWDFDKTSLGEDLNRDYAKLERYPTFFFKILYSLPNLIVSFFSG
ncbi:hypothetical protein A2697_01950 [Candidatus Curtissbacteria bacterium RIFCSPHIGHO2_01_FULL_41_44]|uniref:Uncharacterized protein n=1 Tax=Candidatus Curtissbacteria bacterium RIFCSPLOWO2_01_FULL_42_50 TaxID=1797730 RepID=A0A1F5H3W9_9BACT|nr:MAG: hypothetical protein A2697_01950 [Candidatus Curtissbacteria bacterium RIFCSPHIGHO2_01_FULL_41_44]OGD94623.1 MAG: hypothetical protein A3C33_01100 [Candidatus Curtissbacteria bacterium RIFCSPHIGHO2_02_FULL_42_58]OGD96936.1 MAG: hypothetical protein A3E71_00790 [Candidatus Curtissbacteria bacterium RIFCSPHIGHO2_12_FULL_42_33]OGD98788.1 MAG: hypothetical protein A3B54_03825 [Candidatus Curtissbacteria bacterium RIFCSPLOWO2_01_FULL_42_50]OGE02208.1 MAG: hypothetical protein A3G16_00965 [Ca